MNKFFLKTTTLALLFFSTTVKSQEFTLIKRLNEGTVTILRSEGCPEITLAQLNLMWGQIHSVLAIIYSQAPEDSLPSSGSVSIHLLNNLPELIKSCYIYETASVREAAFVVSPWSILNILHEVLSDLLQTTSQYTFEVKQEHVDNLLRAIGALITSLD